MLSKPASKRKSNLLKVNVRTIIKVGSASVEQFTAAIQLCYDPPIAAAGPQLASQAKT